MCPFNIVSCSGKGVLFVLAEDCLVQVEDTPSGGNGSFPESNEW